MYSVKKAWVVGFVPMSLPFLSSVFLRKDQGARLSTRCHLVEPLVFAALP